MCFQPECSHPCQHNLRRHCLFAWQTTRQGLGSRDRFLATGLAYCFLKEPLGCQGTQLLPPPLTGFLKHGSPHGETFFFLLQTQAMFFHFSHLNMQSSDGCSLPRGWYIWHPCLGLTLGGSWTNPQDSPSAGWHTLCTKLCRAHFF